MVFIDLVRPLMFTYICFILIIVLTGFLYNYYSFVESSSLEKLESEEEPGNNVSKNYHRGLEIVYVKAYAVDNQWIINILLKNSGFRRVVIESVLIDNRLYFFYPGVKLSEYPDIYVPAGYTKEFNITIKQFIGTGFRSGDPISITLITPSKEVYTITLILP